MFELKLDEREARFRAAHILGSLELEADVIDRLVSTTLAMLDAISRPSSRS